MDDCAHGSYDRGKYGTECPTCRADRVEHLLMRIAKAVEDTHTDLQTLLVLTRRQMNR